MKPEQAAKAKLFIGAMFSDRKILTKAKKELEKRLGEIEIESKPYRFNFTNYYNKEMGGGLVKEFLVFKKLIARDKLADVKIFTNKIEKKFAKHGKRKINLDPGYFTMSNLVLATTKERSQRIYLKKGIYGEITLLFRKHGCEAMPWTYPDFREIFVQEFFFRLRNGLKFR